MASPHLYASGDVRLTTAPIPHSDLPLPEPFLSPARVRVPAALNSVIGAWCRHFGGPGSCLLYTSDAADEDSPV